MPVMAKEFLLEICEERIRDEMDVRRIYSEHLYWPMPPAVPRARIKGVGSKSTRQH